MSVNKSEEWIQLIVKSEDLLEYKIHVEGKSKKDEGYLSNILFVTVNGKTTTGENKCLHLVIKSSKPSDKFRQQIPTKEIFEKEIYIYNSVVTSFRTFQEEMGKENFLDFISRCYAAQISDSGELLIFENLKCQGYNLWDRKIPMTYDHIKLVLQAYGKWHAFSLALRNKRSQTFEKLIKNNTNSFSSFVQKVQMVDTMFQVFERAKDLSRITSNERELLQFTTSDIKNIFTDFYAEDPARQVILHGDGWNNNFMFKTELETGQPTSVRILDWQCSGLASPVLDLSYFIYTCCDTEKYKDVKDLLKIYHDSLGKCLSYFGCDVHKIFAYANLLEHWKKYSRYGLVLSGFLITVSVCEANEAPDFAEAAEQGKSFIDSLKFTSKNEEVYSKRMKGNFLHYIKNLNI